MADYIIICIDCGCTFKRGKNETNEIIYDLCDSCKREQQKREEEQSWDG